MTFRKINNWLHLWLGLISGIVVFIVCITGCLWVFNEEIELLLEPWRKVEVQQKPYALPSTLVANARKHLNSKSDEVPWGVHYRPDRAVTIELDENEVSMNPYSGEVLNIHSHEEGHFDFFHFVLDGHVNLWLPYEIGQPLVNYGTLVFVILLITGLIWWYPKKWTKSTREKSFKIKWAAGWKRINLDLHNVLGFYSLLFLFVIAVAGMALGLRWVDNGLYWVFSGGKAAPEHNQAALVSDTLKLNPYGQTPETSIDSVLKILVAKIPNAKVIGIDWADPTRDAAVIRTRATYPVMGTYKSDVYTFDKQTFKILATELYNDENSGGIASRMYYDFHVGIILGFWGKVIAFIATLIGASLPVTGFIIWYNRKWGKKKGKRTRSMKSATAKNS